MSHHKYGNGIPGFSETFKHSVPIWDTFSQVSIFTFQNFHTCDYFLILPHGYSK